MTALILLCAMLLDAALGEPDWLWSRLPHPAVLMGKLIAGLNQKLNTGSARRAKGALCLVVILGVGIITGIVLAELGPLSEGLVAAVLLAQKSLVDHVAAVSRALRRGLTDGRRAVSMIVSRETRNMDESQTARAAIESAAENLSDGVVAPAFWFLIGGLPAMIAYKMVNTADSMIGYRTPKYEDFGWAAARTDDLLNLVPARLTALFLACSSWRFDLRGIRADAALHRSPNAGWPEAAMSRALGIALSGPRTYDGEMQEFAWVNKSGRRLLSPVDIDAAIVMLWKAWALMFCLCALIGFTAP